MKHVWRLIGGLAVLVGITMLLTGAMAFVHSMEGSSPLAIGAMAMVAVLGVSYFVGYILWQGSE